MKGIGPELVRLSPDSIANAWDLIFLLTAHGSPQFKPKGPIQVLHLRGQPTEEIALKGWHSMHTVDWASDGKNILYQIAVRGGAVILRVDSRGNSAVLWKNPGVNWTQALESPDGSHLAFQSASAWRETCG